MELVLLLLQIFHSVYTYTFIKLKIFFFLLIKNVLGFQKSES